MVTPKDLYKYSGKCIYCEDGDTTKIAVEVGFRVTVTVIVRLAGINSPELKSKDPEQAKKAKESKAFLESLILNQTVYFDSKKLDNYGRSIAEIYRGIEGEASINTIMIANGMAVQVKY